MNSALNFSVKSISSTQVQKPNNQNVKYQCRSLIYNQLSNPISYSVYSKGEEQQGGYRDGLDPGERGVAV